MCASIVGRPIGITTVACDVHNFFAAVLSTVEPERAQEIADAHELEFRPKVVDTHLCLVTVNDVDNYLFC